MSPTYKTVRHGIKAEKSKRQEFFKLAERFRNATDPREAELLGDKLGRMIFGVNAPAYLEASNFSAISSIFVTLFQFLPVAGVFNTLSSPAQFSFDRPIPFGK